MEGNRSLSDFFKRRDVWVAIALQVVLSIFLAHGYDFLVEFVAGRNIVEGISPYLGGTLSGWMASGYGPQIQGIGETPLWALYLGLCYFLSAGQPFAIQFSVQDTNCCGKRVLGILCILERHERMAILPFQHLSHRHNCDLGRPGQSGYTPCSLSISRDGLRK